MQLDNTRLAVRERSVLDTHDMSLQVLRDFFAPWLGCTLLLVVPLMVLNYFLIGWTLSPERISDNPFYALRYFWAMPLMIYIEAPLLSIPTVAFLGPAIFMQQPTIKQVIRDVWRAFPQIFVCQILLRGVLVAWLIPFMVDRVYEDGVYWEVFFLPLVAIYGAFFRAFRPFISEIILLERTPLFSRRETELSINKRSSFLHGPSSGDLLARWMGSSFLALILAWIMISSTYFMMYALFSMPDYNDPFYAHLLFPLSLWTVAAYSAVVRYLEYLDLRIRHEGWEVELLMRAEALRLAARTQ